MKWLQANRETNQEMLQAPDFSATTDFYSVAANVYEMRSMPFKAQDLVAPVLPALVPLLLVAFLQIPFQVVLDTLIKLLI